MSKPESKAKLDLSSIPGHWYFRWVYQMRDIDQTLLKAKSEEEAIREGRKILKEYPDLDQPHVVFFSSDGSTTYKVDL